LIPIVIESGNRLSSCPQTWLWLPIEVAGWNFPNLVHSSLPPWNYSRPVFMRITRSKFSMHGESLWGYSRPNQGWSFNVDKFGEKLIILLSNNQFCWAGLIDVFMISPKFLGSNHIEILGDYQLPMPIRLAFTDYVLPTRYCWQ
jgi:hypothetical protein